jgi:hypothetical protein
MIIYFLILSKLIYKFSEIPIKIPIDYFAEIRKLFDLNTDVQLQITKRAKMILKRNRILPISKVIQIKKK